MRLFGYCKPAEGGIVSGDRTGTQRVVYGVPLKCDGQFVDTQFVAFEPFRRGTEPFARKIKSTVVEVFSNFS